MKESSARRTDAFEGLKWRHVLVLLSVLRESDYTQKGHIKKRYNARASRFTETLAFMTCLRAVKEKGGHLQASDILRADDEDEARFWLAERLFCFRNRYRTQIFRYLRRFCVEDGEPTFRPSPASRHRESHVRNFLMEIGVVHYDTSRDCYLIAPEHLALYAVSQDNANKQTPAIVRTANRAKESLGLAAEKVVVSYEQDRVGRGFADRVEHVALWNAAAGYDVRSVTIDENGVVVPRYIEVKAVSASSLQFYWTRNEVLTAKLLSEWYYLYLLPAKTNGRFAINELKMIAHPHSAVLHAPNAWTVEPNVLRCYLRQEGMRDPGVSSDDD